MPTHICTFCQHSFELDDAPRGQAARCPMCGREMPSSATAGIAAGLPKPTDGGYESSPLHRETDDFDDRRIRARRTNWRTALLGLKMAWWSTLAVLVSSAAMSVVQIVWPMDPNDNNPMHPMMAASLLGGCGNGIAGLVALVGIAMCCTAPFAPARRHALTSIVSMVALICALVVFTGVFAYLAAQQGIQHQVIDWQTMLEESGVVLITMGVILVALMLLGYVTWFLFHAAVGDAFGNRSLRRIAVINAIVWPPLTMVAVGFALCPPTMLDVDVLTMVRLQGGVGLFFSLVTNSLYLLLGSQTIATIAAGD